uniref:Uncharacterized protein n=1 Tax=Cacopsylla melanoneura TaxID=428564 RepID=A0A8D8W4F1_9HEMI
MLRKNSSSQTVLVTPFPNRTIKLCPNTRIAIDSALIPNRMDNLSSSGTEQSRFIFEIREKGRTRLSTFGDLFFSLSISLLRNHSYKLPARTKHNRIMKTTTQTMAPTVTGLSLISAAE